MIFKFHIFFGSHEEWGGIQLCEHCQNIGYCTDKCKYQHREQHRYYLISYQNSNQANRVNI